MSRSTPPIPTWIRAFRHPGYVNVYSLAGLENEPRLYCTETLFWDWDAPTLLLAQDAAPAHVIRDRVLAGEKEPWRHGERGRDLMGFLTNERVDELARCFNGSKLYGSALAHMLKDDRKTSGSLKNASSGRLHDHLTRVLEFVIGNMQRLQAIVCLGNEALRLVTSCPGGGSAARLPVGGCAQVEIFGRLILVGRLYHPSRPFSGGWAARHREWNRVAEEVNKRIATSCRG